MAFSPHLHRSRASALVLHTRPVSWPAIRVVGLACALATLGVWTALAVLAAPSARAAAQPALAVSVKSGTATQTVYTVAATGFPAQTAYTETFGDGSMIAPSTGQTNASGAFTLWWTLDAANKYCGTISAQAGGASASASFWIAPSSDAQSGMPCQGTAAGGGAPAPTNTTPTTTGAAATPAATPAATQAAAPQPTVAPTDAAATTTAAPGSGTGLRGLLGRMPWLLIGGGGVVGILLLIVAVAMAGSKKSTRPRGGKRPPTRQMGALNRDPQWGGAGTSARQRAAGRAPQPQAQMPPPGWEGPRTSHRMPGAGTADPRWRVVDPDERGERSPAPDQRWSRSQPGARGDAPPRTLGDATSTRQRAARRDRDDWDRWSR